MKPTIYDMDAEHNDNILGDRIQYECLMGSHAYGCATEESDRDYHGLTIPRLTTMFPHLRGEVQGFPVQRQDFSEYRYKSGTVNAEWVFYALPKYLYLCLQNNPNMLDSLFVPEENITYITSIGRMIRNNKHDFLNTRAYYAYMAYARAQLKAMVNKNPEPGSKRDALRQKYGWDLKFGYNLVRLVDQAEQLLTTGTMVLDASAARLQDIRFNRWNQQMVFEYVEQKQHELEKVFAQTNLPTMESLAPRIRAMLFACIDQYYYGFGAVRLTGIDKVRLPSVYDISRHAIDIEAYERYVEEINVRS